MKKLKFDKLKKLKFKRLNKLKGMVSGSNLIGFETAVIGAVIVYVVVLSGMIKVTSLLTGLVLVGAGTALLFGDSATKNSDDGDADKMNGKYKAKGESLGMFILHQCCVLGMAAMLVLGIIYDNRADFFSWILAIFAAIMLVSIFAQRIVKKYKAS
ncbi:MAG: hypothetical protein HXL78_05125 [[Eubacterium] sulci]|nr:hypothetical protein [[Eubacterium] sulci]MBF1153571.1 hypothetical protein [[Eubacterium] sulci]MBF1177592.1 hypothetical protein [[Eubacterium] sulci]MBF1193260.1 hypothetical protein [[Eubacterium] sulci]